jgi:hypothetical protein
MKSIVALVSAGAALAAFAVPANAFSPGRINAPTGLTSSIAVVCVRDTTGWHYMRGTRRVVCRPVKPKGAHWAWHTEGGRSGWWHSKNRRWND